MNVELAVKYNISNIIENSTQIIGYAVITKGKFSIEGNCSRVVNSQDCFF